MGPSPLLAVYLAPSGFVILSMIMARSFSLSHISRLRSLPRRITLDEWLAVYGFLAIRLESRNLPPMAKPGRPWRLMGAGVALATSLSLYQAVLPFSIPLSFAEHGWNALPIIQSAIAGGLLASSLALAFQRSRRWHLMGHPRAEYPHIEWSLLKMKPPKEEGNRM